MSGLPDEVREQLRRSLMRDICPSCDAGLPYGCACPDLTHLEPLIADLLAAARADERAKVTAAVEAVAADYEGRARSLRRRSLYGGTRSDVLNRREAHAWQVASEELRAALREASDQ